MLLRGKPIETLAENDLEQMIADEVCEQRTLDYKAELHTSTEGEKKELLKDVSSFANAGGGHLIFGMSEDCGKPIEAKGLDVPDQDASWLAIESSIRDGIQPRLSGVTHVWIRLSSGGVVLVIDIPRSFAAPHRVTYRGSNGFFSRGGAGRFEMDVHELRDAFLLENEAADTLRDFLAERLSRIRARDLPVRLLDGSVAAIHIVPASALRRTRSAIATFDFDQAKQLLWPFLTDGYSWGRPNLEGFLTWRSNDADTCHSYAQLFRDGTVEGANQSMLALRGGEGTGFAGIAFEQRVLSSVARYVPLQRALGIPPPVFISLSLLSVRGMGMLTDRWPPMTGNAIDRQDCLLGPVMLESLDGDLGVALRPLFDSLWHACGWEAGSPNYDDEGNWRPYK